jgi:hypothetical protein
MTTLLSKIKNYYFQKHLEEQIKATQIMRKAHNDAKTIGIIFDASSQENREIIAQQAEHLRSKGKKVRILGFFNDKMPHEGTPYPYFNLKEIDWRFIPKKNVDAVTDFAKQPFDLLYTYLTAENKTIDFITAISQANFKAGYYTTAHSESQLMVAADETKGLRFLIKQVDFYLGKINKKYELAVEV